MTNPRLEEGECYDQYEVGGFIFRVGPPRFILREEGDKVICRIESEIATVTPKAPEGESRP